MTRTVRQQCVVIAAATLVVGISACTGQGSTSHKAAGHAAAAPTHTTRPVVPPVSTPPSIPTTTAPSPKPPRNRPTHRQKVAVPGVPAVDVPDPNLTPGAAFTAIAATVCVSGYASSVRDVPDSEKEAVYARYGVPHVPYAHEVDHLVSLELGGSNAISNLWPEPYAGRWGARTKDVLENLLHDLVCAGNLTLTYAQHIEATNWVAAYRRYVGAPPPPSSPPPTRHTTQTAPPGVACEPGYSPCLPIVSDLNCSDIPDALKPIHVTGSDPYRLDADGDGLGCES